MITFHGDNGIFKVGFLLMMRVFCEDVFFDAKEEYILLRFNKMDDLPVGFLLFIALLQSMANYNNLIIILSAFFVFKTSWVC